MGQREQGHSDTSSEPRHMVLAREANLAGMSREQVIAAIIKRIRRDEGYLAYRKASGRRTSYDEIVQTDMRALALAAALLADGTAPTPVITDQQLGRGQRGAMRSSS